MSLAGTLDGARTDEDLIAAVRQGDDRAFEQLYERYHARICAFIARRVGDHGRAEDLTQDVFVSALRRLRRTDAPIAFKAWIHEIAKNACIDAYRRSRRTEEVPIEVFAEHAGLHEPHTAVAAKQSLDDLCGAFGGLSDTHHEILVLREFEGRSYAEIGDRLGMSRPSVESALFRARRRLSEEYDQLVSGERCRAVQAMLADGRVSRREERRVARHIAHCVQCRRAAHLAGHDVVATRRSGVASRVAAWLPLPALLRIRRGGGFSDSASVAGLSQSVAAVAEPAAGWGKAVAATAAMLAAGGAGAVVHHHVHRPAAPVVVHHAGALHRIADERVPAAHPVHRVVVRTPAVRHHVPARTPAAAPPPPAPAVRAQRAPVAVGTAPHRAVPTPTPAAAQALADTVAKTAVGSAPSGTAPDPGGVALPAGTQAVLDTAQARLQATVSDVGSQLGTGQSG